MPRMKNYMVADLNSIDAVRCPCGFAKRAFATPDNKTATVHVVDIQLDARTHYHKTMTEIYVILEGEGHMELDGERIPVKPMTAIFIKPGCRHRAVGKMRIINVPIPAFDAKDEWFDDEDEKPAPTRKPRRRRPAPAARAPLISSRSSSP
jgi:mannose-6-phosphate isomerase-like protein (cupin superfamily)